MNNTIHGYCEIYEPETNKLLGASNNTIMYLGREFTSNKILNLRNEQLNPMLDYYISWFGIGIGGVESGNPLNKITTLKTDTDLNTAIPFSVDGTIYGDYRTGGIISTGWYKSLINTDNISFIQDINNENKYLTTRIILKLESFEAPNEYISEIGLFLSNSRNTQHMGPFYLFSKLTFLPIQNIKGLIFTWFLYF